jgi:hypothetical protein
MRKNSTQSNTKKRTKSKAKHRNVGNTHKTENRNYKTSNENIINKKIHKANNNQTTICTVTQTQTA